MKKKRILTPILALFVCAVLSVSVLGADVAQGAPTIVSNESEISKETGAQSDAEFLAEVFLPETESIRQDILDSIAIMESTSYFDINLNSNGNYFTSTYRMNDSTESGTYRAELTTFINGLFELIPSLRSDGKTDTEGNSTYLAESKIVLRNNDEDGKWNLHTVWVYVKENLVSFKVLKDTITTTFDIPVSDSKKIAEFLANASFTSFILEKSDTNAPVVTAKIAKEGNTYKEVYSNGNYTTFALTDAIDFTFTVPDKYENKVLDEVAIPGEAVIGKVQNYKQTDARNIFIYHLILSGSKNTIELRCKENVSLDGSAELYSYNFPISFTNARRIENSSVVEYKAGKTGFSKLKITFENYEIKEVLFDDIICTNLSYKNYSGDESFANQYVEKTEKDKEALIKEREENSYDVQPQDPERSVTELKGARANDGKVYDYTISFIAQMPVDFTAHKIPGWYKDLGDNVKVTLLGLDQTLDGVSFQNRTMVRFEGSKDAIWFNISSSEWVTEKTSASVKNSYHSLLSFNGKQYIRNTIEYDTMNLDAYFEGADYELKTITVKVGESSVDVNSDNIKYIGGGKMIYENIF